MKSCVMAVTIIDDMCLSFPIIAHFISYCKELFTMERYVLLLLNYLTFKELYFLSHCCFKVIFTICLKILNEIKEALEHSRL